MNSILTKVLPKVPYRIIAYKHGDLCCITSASNTIERDAKIALLKQSGASTYCNGDVA